MKRKNTLIVLDDEAWGQEALELIVEIRSLYAPLTVAVSPEQKFLDTCAAWNADTWFRREPGWGGRAVGEVATDFARIDARELRRAVSERVWNATDATVTATTLGHSPPVVVSGPRYAEQAIGRGLADRLLYICLPKRVAELRGTVGGIQNGQLIEFLPVNATPFAKTAA